MADYEAQVSVDTEKLAFSPNTLRHVLVVTNKGQPVTYKLKTSNPTRYAVKPRMGYVEADSTERIGISFRGVDGKDTSLKDVFQLETRRVTESEERARHLYAQGQLQQAMRELGTEDKAASDMLTWIWKHGSRAIPVKKFHIDCALDQGLLSMTAPARGDSGSRQGTPRGSTPRLGTPRGQNTPRQPTDKLNSLHTAVPHSAAPSASTTPSAALPTSAAAADVERLQSENTRLKAELTTWEQKREELLSANKAHQAAAEELRSKADVVGPTVPAPVFMALTLLFFYLGLAMDRFYQAPLA